MNKRDSAQSRWSWPIALSLLLLGVVLAIAFGAALAHFLLPGGAEVIGESRDVAAGVILAGSYLALAIGLLSSPSGIESISVGVFLPLGTIAIGGLMLCVSHA